METGLHCRGAAEKPAKSQRDFAEVAQSVEHQPSKLRVAGSNLVFRSNGSHLWAYFHILIHCIGNDILKAALRRELDKVLALRCSYNIGDPEVTVVSIK